MLEKEFMKKTPKSWWAEIADLKQQKDVLKLREHLLHRATDDKQRDEINSTTFADLKKVSPEKLVPVVFYSVEHGWMSGFLIQQVGRGGARILVKMKHWRILRVRTSAIIHKIKSAQEKHFGTVVDLQEQSYTALGDLLNELGVQSGFEDEKLPVKKPSRKSA